MSSIFTKIINSEIPSYIVAESDEFIAFLDAFPVQYGHTLIVPKREVDYIFDLGDEELGRMMAFAKQVAVALKKASNCTKVGVAVIGLEVAHAHIHLVPINKEGDMDFKNKIEHPEAEKMEQVLHKIKSYL